MGVDPVKLLGERALPLAFRGYDREATDRLLAEVEKAVNGLASERVALEARLAAAEQRAAELVEREQEIVGALALAARVRNDAEREGREQAERIVVEARSEADRIVAGARARAAELEQEIEQAEQAAAATRGRVTAFLESLLSDLRRPRPDLSSAVEGLVRRAGAAAGGEAASPGTSGGHGQPTVE